eukprot:6838641-Prymnesium_polylepis.1
MAYGAPCGGSGRYARPYRTTNQLSACSARGALMRLAAYKAAGTEVWRLRAWASSVCAKAVTPAVPAAPPDRPDARVIVATRFDIP